MSLPIEVVQNIAQDHLVLAANKQAVCLDERTPAKYAAYLKRGGADAGWLLDFTTAVRNANLPIDQSTLTARLYSERVSHSGIFRVHTDSTSEMGGTWLNTLNPTIDLIGCAYAKSGIQQETYRQALTDIRTRTIDFQILEGEHDAGAVLIVMDPKVTLPQRGDGFSMFVYDHARDELEIQRLVSRLGITELSVKAVIDAADSNLNLTLAAIPTAQNLPIYSLSRESEEIVIQQIGIVGQ